MSEKVRDIQNERSASVKVLAKMRNDIIEASKDIVSDFNKAKERITWLDGNMAKDGM